MIVLILPDIPEEDRLLARARQGSEEAIRQIYDHYFPPIYQFIRMRVDERQAAEDLASDVFLKLVAALRGHSAPRHSLRGWLFRVARNLLHDHYGRRERFAETVLEDWLPAPSEGDPEIQYLRSVSADACRAAIRRLSFEQQEVIVLRFGQMLSLQETADILGKSVVAVKSLQFRAVNSLRRILGEMKMEPGNG